MSGPSERDQTDDELYGTRDRKRVGESWPVDEKILKEVLGNSKMVMKDLSGKVTLKDVLTNAPGPRLLVIVQISGKPASNTPEATNTVSKRSGGSGSTSSSAKARLFPIRMAVARILGTYSVVSQGRPAS